MFDGQWAKRPRAGRIFRRQLCNKFDKKGGSMTHHHIRIRAVEREFDPNKYAHLVIALAKELAAGQPEKGPATKPMPRRKGQRRGR